MFKLKIYKITVLALLGIGGIVATIFQHLPSTVVFALIFFANFFDDVKPKYKRRRYR